MLTNYDPGLIVLTWGPLIISGFSDGTFITTARTEDVFAMKTGAQGDTVRVRNRNANGSITFQLQQTSPVNAALSAALLLDEQTGLGAKPLQLKDLNGTTIVSAPAAWLRKYADAAYSQDAESREWVLDCHKMLPVIGGNLIVVP